LASLSLLVAAPTDSLGRGKKQEARHSRPAVSHAAAKRRAPRQHLAKKLAATKPADGRKQDDRKEGAKSLAAAPLPALRSAILIDAATGAILSETRPDMALYPASLTKMMTLYLTFAALNEGRLSPDQRLPVSSHAAGQAPTKLWLKPSDSVPVEALILGLVTRSANDAAVVLAEALAGNETDFAALMTETARRLGMSDTVFRNASGLPDPQQHTTARDLARLSLALYQDFPREYAYFSVRKFEFRGQTITTHNHMLDSYEGSDGIKTGFIRASGFNLAASAERRGHRLVGIVLGSPSWPVRDREMTALFDRGFAALGTVPIASADTVEPTPASSKRSDFVTRIATYAAPIGKALAAPAPKPAIRPAVDSVAKAEDDKDRAIQLGVFRAREAAARLAKTAARLKPAKGKDVTVRKIRGDRKGGLYTVQVSDFTDKGARGACDALRKAKLRCFVVPEPEEG
jgi:D-alanyl-D-alanine carboxypeptidase